MAQVTAHGFEEVKPELQATPSPAMASQSLASEGLAWAGLWLSGQAGTSLLLVFVLKAFSMVCVAGACSYDVFVGLQVLSTYAGYILPTNLKGSLARPTTYWSPGFGPARVLLWLAPPI